MEKIQQALEKARTERRAALRDTRARSDRAAAAPATAGDNGLTIHYQATQTIQVARRVLQRNRIVAMDARGHAADAFRILRAQVLADLEARKGNAVAICAPTPKAGKTLVAANLAISIAQQLHRSALLVDLDLRSPSVHHVFGIEPRHGLSDYLEGGQPLEACLINPGIERLVLLPQPAPVTKSSELLASPRMAALASELGQRYRERIIIYDCPPLLATDDALITMDYAAGCLLVVSEGRTSRSELLSAAELIGEHRFLGTVLNNARWSSAYQYSYDDR
jgi:protein-tyrosine kinase